MKHINGFTLVEFLTVTVVISSIGLVIVGILSSALRGTNKTNIVNTVRQSGNQAIIQMKRTIEYARSFDGVSVDGTASSYTTNCVEPSVIAPSPTPSPVKYKYLKITAFDGGKITYSCTSASDPIPLTIASNSASLIDKTSVKLVPPNVCWFTCQQERITSNPIIGIKFQLMQSGASALVETTASIPFETSVAFRNLIR